MVGDVSVRFRGARLSDFPDAIVKQVRALPEGGGAVIVGPIGSGKTHLAAAIANSANGLGWETMWLSALDLIAVAKADIAPPKTNSKGFQIKPDNVVETASAFDGLLFLDDATAVRPTEFALDCLSNVIRLRYDRMLPTVVTTHSSFEEISAIFGGAIASRLLEFGPTIKLTGSDRRAK